MTRGSSSCSPCLGLRKTPPTHAFGSRFPWILAQSTTPRPSSISHPRSQAWSPTTAALLARLALPPVFAGASQPPYAAPTERSTSTLFPSVFPWGFLLFSGYRGLEGKSQERWSWGWGDPELLVYTGWRTSPDRSKAPPPSGDRAVHR